MKEQKTINKSRDIFMMLFCYIFWGFQPLYYNLMADTDAMFLLMSRILWGGVFVVSILFFQRRTHQILEAFRNRQLMKHLIPGAIFSFLDWGIYMIAIMSGHVIDASLGYYVGPLVICFIGILVFREKLYWESVVAIALIITGILVSGNNFGHAPWVTISLALCFSIYAACMKGVTQDSILCTAVQLIMMAPFALAFILFFRMGDTGMASMTFNLQAFLIGAGIITVIPILVYASCVKRLSLTLMGVMQYSSPTFGIISGLLLGEKISSITLFIFVWAALILYSIASGVRDRKAQATHQEMP